MVGPRGSCRGVFGPNRVVGGPPCQETFSTSGADQTRSPASGGQAVRVGGREHRPEGHIAVVVR